MLSKILKQQHWIVDLLLLSFISAVFFTLFLGSYPLHLPDEGRYAEVAWEMLANHNLVTPTLNGLTFFDKPPLYYWLAATTMHLNGITEWSARLGPALFGILSVLGIYIAGRLISSRNTGWIAAGLLATTPLYFLSAHFANCDLIEAAALSLSMFSFLIAIENINPSKRRFAFLSAYFWSALAVLAKGLIGIVFPIGIIGLYILCFNRWSLLKDMRLISGLLLIAIIVLPWFIAVSKANPSFLHYFFYIQHYQRFIGNSFNNREPFWFYLPIVLAGFWPWTLWLIQAIKQGIYESFVKKTQMIDGFLLLWALLILVFFSIPTSKTIGYILPIFPPLALLVARFLASSKPTLKKSFQLIWLIPQLIAALLILIVPYLLHQLALPLVLTTSLGACLFIANLAIYLWISHGKSFVPALILSNAFCLIALLSLANSLPQTSSKPLALWLKDHQVAEASIYTYNIYPFDLPFYLQKRVNVVTYNWQDSALAKQDSWQGEFAYSLQNESGDATHFVNRDEFLKRWQQKQPIYVIISSKHLSAFEKDIGNPPLTVIISTHKLTLATQKLA